MSGTLTISDAGQFTALLTQGLGRQRGYGFGFIRLEPTH